ncbi:4-hydroxy-3-methylbut-2-enyl diphosphate reductase [Desulfomicrobium macestii]|uniref:4-hydroxy-3-methylbut-2-enyl diphosphate reductase n=1 Tax=Desulfomicrobium macestii TaxID=90731 RepID=A0ABR9H7A5_9BACT|nr:4-hydroxy-3-methylbut-2-enyl diphosphate reductase [Desulfomicrobium macestii]MBE1426595.1 4-hydroxy-3-methylbut-2-enyl diphosphate reductase [Desulfomicrobium macestii]
MELVIAKTAGFCMGVDMALHKLDNAVAAPPQDATIYTLGPIIHNPQVLARYKEQGVLQTDGAKPLKTGDVVVIRAHGIPRNIQSELEAQNVTIVDATCPKVKKAQILIQRQADQNKHLLLFGERDHPEVQGLVSYAPRHTVFESLEELCGHEIDSAETYFLAAQTTQDRESFNAVREYLLKHVDADMSILDTICMATKDRQEEVRELSHKVQAMVIVGGKNSGNTRRLAQIAQESGIFAVHVETAEELPLKELAAFERIGLTAGASTPSWIIENVAQTLRKALPDKA